MKDHQLQRVYRISGLDRILYASEPDWDGSTFRSLSEEEGELSLVEDGIRTSHALEAAIGRLDACAERFRLALSLRFLRVIHARLIRSVVPDVDPPGILQAHATATVSAECTMTVAPGPPPPDMPQLPRVAARWIATLAETDTFGPFPDEIFKRFYLIIEELWAAYKSVATSEQSHDQLELKYIRHFVSHEALLDPTACTFIAAQLPSAVISHEPLKVRFDRTSIEHRNFVGSYDPKARALATWLVNKAIASLPPDV